MQDPPISVEASDRARFGLGEAPRAPAASAFEEFFDAERQRLFRAVYLMTGSIQEAEEITQDAFLRVWERWDRVQAMESPIGYLYRTAMNVFRSRARRMARAARSALPLASGPDPFDAAENHDSVIRALRRLAPRQRAALVLTDLLDYSSQDGARLLHVRPTTVRNLAFQARAVLRSATGASDV